MTPRVLIIAGSDSGGGAGVQADIKTVTAMGGYAATAITALTIQDTVKVHHVLPVPPDVIRGQMRAVLRDVGADAIKIGMIGSVAAGEAILKELPDDIPLIVDPVLVASSGDALGAPGVTALIKNEFLPRARIITPNVPEATALSGREISCADDLLDACRRMEIWGASGIMAKAGHLDADPVPDFYYENGSIFPLSHPRQSTRHTHGTGCTLASALAAGIAQGLSARDAAREAVAFVTAAMAHAPGLGKGHGPLQHGLLKGPGGWTPITK